MSSCSTIQVETLLGCAMTYTLFEYAKENTEELMQNQPEAVPVIEVRSISVIKLKLINLLFFYQYKYLVRPLCFDQFFYKLVKESAFSRFKKSE